MRGVTTVAVALTAFSVAGNGSPSLASTADVPASPASPASWTSPASPGFLAFPRSSAAGPVKPRGHTVGTHKVRWTSAKPIKHGRHLRVTWWSGVEPCAVLDRVKVRETARKVVVTVYEGADPSAADKVCPAIAIKKTTTVKLKAPLGPRKIIDGAR